MGCHQLREEGSRRGRREERVQMLVGRGEMLRKHLCEWRHRLMREGEGVDALRDIHVECSAAFDVLLSEWGWR